MFKKAVEVRFSAAALLLNKRWYVHHIYFDSFILVLFSSSQPSDRRDSVDERYHRGFYLMAIDGQRFSGHLFAPLLTPFAMQIYIFDNCFSNLDQSF